MGYLELIEKLKALPQDKQAEVFDFVDFLSAQAMSEGKEIIPEGWKADEYADFSLAQAMRGMEDDPVSYTKEDIKEAWL